MVEQLRELASARPDFKVIADLVSEGSSLLDLGCADGALVKLLELEKNVHSLGVEGSQDMVLKAVQNGASVIHKNLNDGLDEFSDGSFEFVVLSRVLQAVDRPDMLLTEMLRVGSTGIISFVNMGYIRARAQLMFKGKMPVTKTLPYKWYDTPNTHLATISDFKALCKQLGIKVVKQFPLGKRTPVLAKIFPNMFASTCVFLVSKIEVGK